MRDDQISEPLWGRQYNLLPAVDVLFVEHGIFQIAFLLPGLDIV